MTRDREQQEMVRCLARTLRELPEAYEQLWMFFAPRSQPPLDGLRHTGDVFAAVVSIDVVDLTDEREKLNADPYPNGDMEHGARRLGVLPTLSRWVRFVDEQRITDGRPYELPYRFVACGGSCRFLEGADTVTAGDSVCDGERLSHWPSKTVATESQWLLDQLDFIQDQDWLGRFYDEITTIMGDIHKIIGSDKPATYACLNCGWDLTPRYNGQAFHCPGCGRDFGWIELRNMAEAMLPVTIKEAAERSGTSVRLLKDYVTAGKIIPLEKKQGAAKLYDFRDVMLATQELRYRKSPSKDGARSNAGG
jgi:hypothetical protein